MTEYEKYWRLKELKEEGHKLIKQVAKKKNITVSRVYQLLQDRMGFALEESAHFRNMHTVRDIEKAISELNNLLKSQPKPRLKPVTLPLAEQKRLLGAARPVYVWLPMLSWRRIKIFTLAPKRK